MKLTAPHSTLLALFLAPLAPLACGDDTTPRLEQQGASGGTSAEAGKGGGASSGDSGASGGDSGAGANVAAGGEAQGRAGESGGGPEAVYALTTQVFGEQAADSLSYVLLSSTLEGGALSLDDAVIEIVGRALGTAPDDSGALFVATDAGPAVTRYELTEDGALEKRGSVDFLSTGISQFGEYGGQFQYVSPDKAYWFDGLTAQIVEWNPETMEIVERLSLSELAHASELLSFTAVPIREGSRLYSFAAWRTATSIPSRLAVVVLDTETNDLTVVEDSRCGYVRDGVLAEDGMLYVATEAYGAALNYLNPSAAKAPCLLRFDVTTNEFDPDFGVELPTLFAGAPAGSLIVGPGNQAFLRYLDLGASAPATMNGRVLASSPAWGWAKLFPSDEPSVEKLANIEPSSGSVLPFQFSGRTFAPTFIAAKDTAIVELGADGPIADPALEVPGLVFSIAKLR